MKNNQYTKIATLYYCVITVARFNVKGRLDMLNITDHFTTPTAYTERCIYVVSTHASTCKTTSSSLSMGEWTGEGGASE